MKLYEVPRNSYISLLYDESSPPDALPNKVGDQLKFKHLDGMYGWCIDKEGNDRYIPAWADVSVIEKINTS